MNFRLSSFQSVAAAKIQAAHHVRRLHPQRAEYIKAAKNGDLSVITKHQKPTNSKLSEIYDETDNDNSLLHISALHQQLHIVETLLKIGFPTNIQNRNGDTALHLCLRRNETYIPIIEALIIDGNADITIRNKVGETPQLILAFSNHLKRIPILNQLLEMNKFRSLESGNKNGIDGINIFTQVRAMVSEMNPTELSIYRQVWNKLTRNHAELRQEDLFDFFNCIS